MIRIALTAVVLGAAAAACVPGPAPQAPAPVRVPLSEETLAEAVRETLAQGAAQAVSQLGRSNGFWSNAAVRIPLPEPLLKPAESLRKLGMGARVDEFHRALNSAAEQAVPYVAEALAAAARELTLDDAQAVLDGGVATQRLRERSGAALAAQLQPYVRATTERIGIVQRYRSLADEYGVLLRGAGLAQADLDTYVTQKTIDGVFYLIAAEEVRIRRDPRARSTELMRQVYGSL